MKIYSIKLKSGLNLFYSELMDDGTSATINLSIEQMSWTLKEDQLQTFSQLLIEH